MVFYILSGSATQESLVKELFIGMYTEYVKTQGIMQHPETSNSRGLLPPCYGLNRVPQANMFKS